MGDLKREMMGIGFELQGKYRDFHQNSSQNRNFLLKYATLVHFRPYFLIKSIKSSFSFLVPVLSPWTKISPLSESTYGCN